MTVSELMEKLSKVDPGMQVVTSDVFDEGEYKLVDLENADIQILPVIKEGGVYERVVPPGPPSNTVLVISAI